MFKSFMVGGLAGAVAKTLIAPFDRVKILFQVSHVPFTYRGVVAEVQRTLRHEGFLAMFRGNAAQVLRVYPYSGTQLMAYDQYARLILGARHPRAAGNAGTANNALATGHDNANAVTRLHGSRLTPSEKMAAGAAAGATSVVVTYPLDLMRARLAVQTMHDAAAAGGQQRFTSIRQAFAAMYAEHGLLQFYRGMGPTLAGMAPYAGISFTINETLKQAAQDAAGGADPAPWVKFICGGVAGLVGQAATYPLDVVRRRMQTEGFTVIHAHAAAGPAHAGATAATDAAASTSVGQAAGLQRGGMLQTLHRIVEHEGMRGLFKGFSMNLLKGPIGVGLSFTMYDLLKKGLGVAPVDAGAGAPSASTSGNGMR